MLPVVAIVLLVTSWCEPARADVFVLGSTFTVQAFNSPDSFTETVTLTPGNQLLDSGAVNLNIALVPVGSQGAEWIVFDYTTTNGGALSLPTKFWGVEQTGIDLSVPAQLTEFYMQFTDDGVAQAATSWGIFGPGVVSTNPIPGGVGTGDFIVCDPSSSGFGTCSFPVGPFPSFGAELGPFDRLDSVGIVSADVNGWEDALLFQPVPEPASLVLTCTALLGLIALRRRGA
jgi:hypothetical protein